MKNEDLLLYGGIAVAAYFLFLKPKHAGTLTPVAPITHTSLPLTTSPHTVAVNANPINQIATTIANLIKGGGSGGPNPATAATVAPYVPVYSGSGGAAPPLIDSPIFANDDSGNYSGDQNPTLLEQNFRQGMFDNRNGDFNPEVYA